MGAALANCIHANGHPLTVWNRTKQKAEPFSQKGVNVASSVAQAAEASDVIIVNVLNYEVNNKILHTDEVAEEIRGKTVVQLTTGTPKEAHADADWAKANGAKYLDGAIMAIADTIGTPHALFFYSGERAVFEENETLFRELGGNPSLFGRKSWRRLGV